MSCQLLETLSWIWHLLNTQIHFRYHWVTNITLQPFVTTVICNIKYNLKNWCEKKLKFHCLWARLYLILTTKIVPFNFSWNLINNILNSCLVYLIFAPMLQFSLCFSIICFKYHNRKNILYNKKQSNLYTSKNIRSKAECVLIKCIKNMLSYGNSICYTMCSNIKCV